VQELLAQAAGIKSPIVTFLIRKKKNLITSRSKGTVQLFSVHGIPQEMIRRASEWVGVGVGGINLLALDFFFLF